MLVKINDRRLFFEVDDEKLTPRGPNMFEKPTLIVLHGAPGMTRLLSEYAEILTKKRANCSYP